VKTRLLAILLLFPLCSFAQTYTFSTLVNFPSSSKKGPFNPNSLTIDSAGNLYGLSTLGGTYGGGTLFKVTPKGVLSVLYSFGGTDTSGFQPYGSVIRDSEGDFYGETFLGGTSNYGTIFKITPPGKETTLYSFSQELSVEGGSSMTRDSAGNLYGYNFNGNGSVFELATEGTYRTLYAFCSLANCTDGAQPAGGPIIRNGKLYGMTSLGGTNTCGAETCGTVFEMDTSGNETILHNFAGGTDGYDPPYKLTQDAAGNLYGATGAGGAHGWGTLFKITPSGQESVLYAFCAQSQCTDGASPGSPLVLDTAGNIFGTSAGTGVGPNQYGLVYKITSGGVETTLHDATGPAGVGSTLVMDKAGNLYGDTWGGGPSHTGNIYKLTKK
jgi:uncharacterized repeat protein (TIGR03803 family)